MRRLRWAALSGRLPPQAPWGAVGDRGGGVRPALQSVLRQRGMPPPRHAAVSSISRPAGVRRGDRGARERRRAGGGHGGRWGSHDGCAGSHDTSMAALVAWAVHGERRVRGCICSPGAGARSSHHPRFALGATWRRRSYGPRETVDLAGADHHGELPGRIALGEGRDVIALETRFAQKMALPAFLPPA